MKHQLSRRVVIAAATVVVGLVSVNSSARADLIFYEGFDYAVGDLHNQDNTSVEPDDVWTRVGTVAAANIDVSNGSLTSPVGSSTGKKATITNPATASVERLNFPTISSGSVWYSLTLNANVGAATVNQDNGAFFAGLSSIGDNGDVDTAAPLATGNIGARLALRRDPTDGTKLNLALSNSVGQTAALYSPTLVNQNTDVFMIVQYEVVAGNINDISRAWINPNPATFDPSSTPSLTVTGQNPDLVNVQSFFLRQTGGLPETVSVDEVRVGTSHLDITPQTYYWDIDGANPGAGGTAPNGNWDGVSTNFNHDATGGGGSVLRAGVNAWDTVSFGAGSDATGLYGVTVSDTRSAGTVKIEEGTVVFTGGTLAVGTYDVASGSTAVVLSDAAGGVNDSVTKTGPGVLSLIGSYSYTGGTNVNQGVMEVTRLHDNNPVSIAAGATLKVRHSTAAGANPESGDNAFVSRPSALSIADGGTLDLTNNDLILDYTGGSPRAAIEALVRSGFNGGDWLGDGITSSTAALDPNFHLAIADNAELSSPFGTANGGPLFSGQDVDLTTILVKFTHRIDLDMDGLITPNDSAIFGTNYDDGQPAYWAIGDIDMDGFFTPNDSAIFGTFYDEAVTSLPEPASFGLLGLGAMALARRQRRN